MQTIKEQNETAELMRQTAELALSPREGWTTYGPPGRALYRATVAHDGQEFTMLRDESNRVLVYTNREWDAFVDGVRKGEFDELAGLRSAGWE
ncbi:DUF397 domain-containing protein [Amycolatopsis sp. NPDC004368]